MARWLVAQGRFLPWWRWQLGD